MSNHFTGLSLGPPLGDQRLDLCDLYAFQSPADPDRTVLILNANPTADALHPDAVYRLNIDNDGDLRDDIAFSFVYSEPQDGRQTVDVYLAYNAEAEADEAVGSRIFEGVEVSFGATPNIVTAGSFTFFAGARSDAFFFDFDGIKNLFDTSGGRNFTAPHLGGDSPWTGVDSNTEANVFSMVLEMPTSALGADPDVRIWGRCSLRRDGELLHVDRAGHPSVNTRPFGYLRGLRRVEREHVGQRALLLDRLDGFLAAVPAGVAHQVDEHPIQRSRSRIGSPALYSSLVSSVLKKLLTDGCPARSTCSSSPSRRRLHRPQIRTSGSAPSALVGISSTIENTLASVLESTPVHGESPPRCGAVKLRPPTGVEQVLDAVEVEEERVAACAGEECEASRRDDVRGGAEGNLDTFEDARPHRLVGFRVRVVRQVHVDGLAAVLWFGVDEAERDVITQVAVVVDVDPIDGVRVQRVSGRVGVEDQDGAVGIGGRLKRVEVAEVQALIAQRRAEAQAGEVVRHSAIQPCLRSLGARNVGSPWV